MQRVQVRQRGDATRVNPAEVAEEEPVSISRIGSEEAVVPSVEPREP